MVYQWYINDISMRYQWLACKIFVIKFVGAEKVGGASPVKRVVGIERVTVLLDSLNVEDNSCQQSRT